MRTRRPWWWLAWVGAWPAAWADTTYLAPDAFVRQALGESASEKTAWIDAPAQRALTAIYGHPFPAARVRYWQAGARSAWVLEDIGKEFPITAGFVVDGARLESAQLLIYRESRGDEIRTASFLRQFKGAGLRDGDLDVDIDAISGATLSSAAMRRMARTALLLAPRAP